MKMPISTNPPPSSPRQRGAALLIAMLIVVLGLVTLLTLRGDRKAPEMEAQRKTALALAQAKEAIIGRAVINGIPTNSKQNPGALSCPDRDNDGDIDTSASICSGGPPVTVLPGNTGRFPWKSLGMADLRDLAGERLWYIIAPEFVDKGTAINSTAMPSLQVVENGVARNVAAIVITPGRPLAGQDRLAPNTLTNYIEGYNDTTKTFTVMPVSAIYNDQIITITAKELFSVVTQRMARELSLTAYTGTIGTTIALITMKPPVWTSNNWNNAVDTSTDALGVVASGISDPNPGITPKVIKLKFSNCNVTYTITGPGNVTRDKSSC